MEDMSLPHTVKKAFWETLSPKNSATHRLFIFPFSGGSPLYFREWCDLVPESVEVCVLSAPGKGRRVMEKPIETMEELVGEIVAQKDIFLEKEFSFFGHSMGAWMAAETCWRLQDMGCDLPRHFVISGSIPFCFKRLPPYVHQMTDDELISELKILGGTPEDLLNDRNFIKNYLPGIRADFKIFESHINRHSKTIPVDISIWNGLDDPRVPASLGQYWKMFTQGQVRERFFSGGHMFIDGTQSRMNCIDELKNIMT